MRLIDPLLKIHFLEHSHDLSKGIFIDEFQEQYPNTTNVMILDQGAFHAAKSLEIPKNLILLFLPPYSPELNPIERYWKHLKDQIA